MDASLASLILGALNGQLGASKEPSKNENSKSRVPDRAELDKAIRDIDREIERVKVLSPKERADSSSLLTLLITFNS